MVEAVMTKYAITRPALSSVPIKGSEALFPVRRIYCVGQNYAKHVAEMGGRPQDRNPPFFFQKPSDAIVVCRPEDNVQIAYPKMTKNLHHEVEMVIAIGRGGDFIAKESALSHVFGLAIGVDLTRRDRQAEMKAQSRSWEIAKAFDDSAPISRITPLSDSQTPIASKASIGLRVNGKTRQEACISEMIWSPAEIIATLSTHYTLHAGDLIYSGTPQGVAAISIGDSVEATLEGVDGLKFTLV